MLRAGAIISDRYEILGRIGTGGMADVYKAVDQKLNRFVAIKVLKSEFREDETFLKKFQTEAQSAAGLSHPSIVNIFDVSEDRGVNYIVMEFIDGITLKEYIQKKGNLTPKEVISIAVQVCNAMEVAHGRNIVHRDIKPQNIMITKEGKVKVTDFGIAKVTSSNTISTNMMGSVHYTSPEQARGGFSDAKSDIYSLGISMYEMITGELPFDGESTVTIALQHLQDDITPPSELVPDIPYSLEQIILKCTQKSPDRRYADITLLAKDLRKSLADPDGDFVVIAPLRASTETRKITEDELKQIQAGSYTSFDGEYDDDDYEERRARRREENEKGVDPKMARIMKILAIVVAVIFIVILGFGIAKVISDMKIGSGHSTTQDDKEKIVPSLVGKTLDEAKKLCRKEGLEIEVVREDYSSEHEEGIIIEQMTEAGVEMMGNQVQVVVSKGLMVEWNVDDLDEMEYVDARDMLIDWGFDKKNIQKIEEAHPEIETDLVIRIEPDEDVKLIEDRWIGTDAKINIYVSAGLEVPELIGKTQEEAEALLKEWNLTGKANEVESSEEEGKVIGQAIPAGTSVEKDTVISYDVSVTKTAVIPYVADVDVDWAKYELELQGFVNSVIKEEHHPSISNGKVIRIQDAGKKVPISTQITIVISKGPEVTEPPQPEVNSPTEGGDVTEQ